MDLVPFPKEPDAAFAQALYASVAPIIDGCKDDEWRSHRDDLKQTRNPDFARYPWTSVLKKVSFETRMQLAIAFIDMHGKQGVTPSLKHTNPRLYGLQKFLFDCCLEQWIWHEVDLRAGAMPIPFDTRAWDFAEMLTDESDGLFKLVTPRPPEIPMPKDHVYIRAREWYDHTCTSITEGCYLPVEEDKN